MGGFCYETKIIKVFLKPRRVPLTMYSVTTITLTTNFFFLASICSFLLERVEKIANYNAACNTAWKSLKTQNQSNWSFYEAFYSNKNTFHWNQVERHLHIRLFLGSIYTERLVRVTITLTGGPSDLFDVQNGFHTYFIRQHNIYYSDGDGVAWYEWTFTLKLF